jgi:succinate dehydrogenase/fumarate reductase flavoprotein subunit
VAGENAVTYSQNIGHLQPDPDFLEAEKQRIFAPLTRPNGIPHTQVEYKLWRFVNDYLQPPEVGHKMEIGLNHFVNYQVTLEQMGARDPHELKHCMEVHFIRDCAEMAARSSLYRSESRWGLYHYRVDYPEKNDQEWFAY